MFCQLADLPDRFSSSVSYKGKKVFI